LDLCVLVLAELLQALFNLGPDPRVQPFQVRLDELLAPTGLLSTAVVIRLCALPLAVFLCRSGKVGRIDWLALP
jgi:hypothetical protein